jgi:hypothetical protein
MFAFHLHDQERLELMFSVGSKQGRGSPVSGFCWVFLIRLNVSVSPFFQYLCDVLISVAGLCAFYILALVRLNLQSLSMKNFSFFLNAGS